MLLLPPSTAYLSPSRRPLRNSFSVKELARLDDFTANSDSRGIRSLHRVYISMVFTYFKSRVVFIHYPRVLSVNFHGSTCAILFKVQLESLRRILVCRSLGKIRETKNARELFIGPWLPLAPLRHPKEH
jgi:hypothetical protein